MKLIREILGDRQAYSVSPGMTVREVVDYLVEKSIGAVAVCDGPKVVGVFSERDLMRRVVSANIDAETAPISDVMTRDVFSVKDDERHNVAMALMLDKNFRHLVVTDDMDRFRGFVSMRDLLEVEISEARELIARLNDDYYHHEFDTKRDQ